MFTTPCFIRKNTKELRDKLSLITGTDRWLFSLRNGYGKYIIHSKGNDASTDSVKSSECDLIDCGKNEDLFLTIAALRDDTDRNQLFFHNKDTECKYPIECIHDEFHLIQIDAYMFRYEDHKDEYHKDTVEELIKHFKNK